MHGRTNSAAEEVGPHAGETRPGVQALRVQALPGSLHARTYRGPPSEARMPELREGGVDDGASASILNAVKREGDAQRQRRQSACILPNQNPFSREGLVLGRAMPSPQMVAGTRQQNASGIIEAGDRRQSGNAARSSGVRTALGELRIGFLS